MKHWIWSLAAAIVVTPALEMLPPASCHAAAEVAHCEAAKPKSWTEEEQRTIQAALERLGGNELARGVIAAALGNGYRGLHRYETDTQRAAGGAYVSKFGPGFVLYTPKVIGITDAFFELAEVKDGQGGYRVGDLVLLHELIHAYDDRSRSTDQRFLALTGWAHDNGRWQYRNQVSWTEYNGVYAETLTLYARGRYAEAWSRDRAFATTLGSPVPRIQSLVTPAETFADILAHLLLDRTSRTYLSEAVVEWFEQQVFPALREQPLGVSELLQHNGRIDPDGATCGEPAREHACDDE